MNLGLLALFAVGFYLGSGPTESRPGVNSHRHFRVSKVSDLRHTSGLNIFVRIEIVFDECIYILYHGCYIINAS